VHLRWAPGSRSPLLPGATLSALMVAGGGVAAIETGPPGTAPAHVTPAHATLALSVEERVVLLAAEAAEAGQVADLAARRQAATREASARRGRTEATERAARAAKRTAAAAAARAKRESAATAARTKAAEAMARARAKRQRDARRWTRPIGRWNITSGYGPRWGKTHDGLDVGAPTGTPLHAMSRGTVILAGAVASFGKKVEIRYWDGTVSWYAHLSRIDVRTGQAVAPGQRVGAVGNTGHSFGSHLHLEIHPTGGDHPVDPYPWLKRKGLVG
jgi:murein DD-endopeptidase MepM/ murein hydrolase activator NlpD